MSTEPGLIERCVIFRDAERVVFNETWDLDAPGCPMNINNYFSSLRQPDHRYLRQITMTPIEFDERFKD